MRANTPGSAPPYPLERDGSRSSPYRRAPRRLARATAVSSAIVLGLFAATNAVAAGPPAAIVGTGLTEPAGVIVDPDGHPWVADGGSGFCRVGDAGPGGPGAIDTASCDANAAGEPAEITDPTGATYVLTPDAGRASTFIDRLVWNSGTHRFEPDATVDVGIANAAGVSAGPDGNAYVIFTRLPDVKRISNPTGADPAVAAVGHTAGVRGAAAIAAGRDKNGAPTVYLAENVGGGISALHPGSATTSAVATSLGNPGESFGGLAYDATTNVLYGGSQNIAIPDQFVDALESFDIAGGTQNLSLATGFGGIGGVGAGPSGQVLAVDDPSANGDAGAGRLLAGGVPAAQIVDGPAAVTRDASPTFSFTATADPLCAVTPVTTPATAPAFGPCTSATTNTAAGLADGRYTFAVEATGGFPVTRSFAVDTVAPAMTIDSPAEGASTSASPSIAFHPSESASMTCRLDTGAFAACSSPRAYSGLAAGRHTFDVRATDAAGNTGAIATVHFDVPVGGSPGGSSAPAGAPFTPAGPGSAAATTAGAAPVAAIPGAGVLGAGIRHRAPSLTIALHGGAARLHGTAVALPVRCGATCVASVRGTVAVRGSTRLYRLAGGSKVLRGERSGQLVVHVPRSSLSLLRRALRAGRTVTMRLALRAEDVAGNARTRTVSVRLRAS
jgi:hypothetical protein